jgi:hypothetical protein
MVRQSQQPLTTVAQRSRVPFGSDRRDIQVEIARSPELLLSSNPLRAGGGDKPIEVLPLTGTG